jgi:hypothetical protein
MIKTTSADGTAIAADRTGSGPALVLVAPALATHATFAPLGRVSKVGVSREKLRAWDEET